MARDLAYTSCVLLDAARQHLPDGRHPVLFALALIFGLGIEDPTLADGAFGEFFLSAVAGPRHVSLFVLRQAVRRNQLGVGLEIFPPASAASSELCRGLPAG